MVRMVLLLVVALLLLGGCAESLLDQRGSDPISQASTCAMCGASVSSGYLDYGTDRSVGPGRNW